MAKTVWKYQFPKASKAAFEIPSHAIILRADMQDGTLCLWALVEPLNDKETREFSVVGTGHPVPPFSDFVDTVMDAPFVWHVFEEALTP